MIVSVQRLVLTAIVAYAVVMGSGRAGSCSLQSECAYGVLVLVLILDAIGSVVWGNPLAGDASFSVTKSFSILLDNQLTSSIASQAVLALHFVYVSCRLGRGARLGVRVAEV